MVWELPHVSCPRRAGVARDLLYSETIDINDEASLKFGRLFGKELMETANTGELPLSIYEFLCDVFMMWRLDTQEIEGVNSVLKYCAKISSNLGW
eukprot:8193008-Pyramimonas_sp.AAC.1